jgi:7-cyano-7-deazaguanine synthase
MKLRKKNDIVLYYNTENHEIEYLHGQQNDIGGSALTDSAIEVPKFKPSDGIPVTYVPL